MNDAEMANVIARGNTRGLIDGFVPLSMNPRIEVLSIEGL
jgi:hypothetical protein